MSSYILGMLFLFSELNQILIYLVGNLFSNARYLIFKGRYRFWLVTSSFMVCIDSNLVHGLAFLC